MSIDCTDDVQHTTHHKELNLGGLKMPYFAIDRKEII
jgi:hypothetical protein